MNFFSLSHFCCNNKTHKNVCVNAYVSGYIWYIYMCTHVCVCIRVYPLTIEKGILTFRSTESSTQSINPSLFTQADLFVYKTLLFRDFEFVTKVSALHIIYASSLYQFSNGLTYINNEFISEILSQ